MRTAFRTLMVAVALTAWVAISNHCAFAGIALKWQGTNSECPFHSKPAKPQKAPAGIQCCKILRAITTASAKIVPRGRVDVPHVDLVFDAPSAFPPARVAFAPDTVDTGPPGRTSFTELIGSVQAHAPPSRA